MSAPVDPKWDQRHSAADAGTPHGSGAPTCAMWLHQCGRRMADEEAMPSQQTPKNLTLLHHVKKKLRGLQVSKGVTKL